MEEKRPFIVKFIGDISILGGLVWLIITLLYIFKVPGIIIQPIYGVFSGAAQLLLPITFLIISFGYLRLKRWGYWLLLTVNTCFLIIEIISLIQSKHQSFHLSIINSVISLLFIIPTRKYFNKDNLSM